MFFKCHGETRVQLTEQPKGKQHVETFQYLRDEALQNATPDAKDFWKDQGHNALQFKQETIRNCCPREKRV